MRWVITTSDPLYKVPIDHREPAWGGREISFSRGGWLNGFCICTSALKMVQTAPLGDLVEPRPAVRNYCPPNRPGTPLTVAACRWRHAAGRRLWPDHRLIAIPGCTDIYGSCPSRSATYFEAHVKFRAPPGRFSIGTCIVGRRHATAVLRHPHPPAATISRTISARAPRRHRNAAPRARAGALKQLPRRVKRTPDVPTPTPTLCCTSYDSGLEVPRVFHEE